MAKLMETAATNLSISVFEGCAQTFEASLARLGEGRFSFGRDGGCDLVIPSPSRLISRHHGFIEVSRNGVFIYDDGSTNGIRVNGSRVQSAQLAQGDVVTIGRPDRLDDCVTMVIGAGHMTWSAIPLPRNGELTIGRAPENDLVIASPAVSGHHAAIVADAKGGYSIVDLDSYNGTYVMGRPVYAAQPLEPGDIISIALTTLVFAGSSLLECSERGGVEVVAHDLVQVRKNKGTQRVTTDHISLHVRRGDFVAIVGGSGSGKSTLLNELNGSDPAKEGVVLVDGISLYPNYSYLKNAIGYVPQQDIVYDDLTLVDMLRYAAELRMPPDCTPAEREQRVAEVIDLLELSGETNNYIGRLSGGQKKRASIAVELLADPRLLFLDEPTSGLDPGIERDLMGKLAKMAHEGRTILLVTHTTLNLHLCSQVVFLGPGGKLCFAGAPQDALAFFGVDDFVPIYDMISKDAETWARRFKGERVEEPVAEQPGDQRIAPSKSPSFASQLSTLSRRYAKLILNDRQRLALLLLQAPALSALICLVAGSDCFVVCENTKSCLFALSCAAFWVGILDSIQEVCKERSILQREYAGGLRLSAYVLSKVLVLGVLCIVQSALLTGVFCALNGLPSAAPLFVNAGVELFITMLLLTLSAMCLGLWISTLFSNPDRAIAMAPILIMPQVLFSGLIFELKGIAKSISVFVNCRWAMEAFGTTADLNSLDLSIYGEEVVVPAGSQHIDSADVPVPDTTTTYMGQEITVEGETRTIEDFDVDVPEQTRTIDGQMYAHDPDDAYLHILPHLMFDWGVLAVFCVVCVALSGITLRRTVQGR